MALKSPQNPAVVGSYKVRGFDGVAGPDNKVLRRTGQKDEDYSTSIANEVQDLSLGIRGMANLRDGNRKINSTGNHGDVDSIFNISANGNMAYGEVLNGTLTIVSVPTVIRSRRDPIDLEPKTVFSAITSEYVPAGVGEPIL